MNEVCQTVRLGGDSVLSRAAHGEARECGGGGEVPRSCVAAPLLLGTPSRSEEKCSEQWTGSPWGT